MLDSAVSYLTSEILLLTTKILVMWLLHWSGGLPKTKGPALFALLPDIPAQSNLLGLPDDSPAPRSEARRLDIL